MIRGDLWQRSQALLAERASFVVATVVRARHPTSVRPGDAALVHADGRIEGFVGGVCAEASVRLHALRVLETGEPLLLRLVPEGEEAAPHEGAVTVRNECLSGGGLEIFLEPQLPAPRLVVHGETPVAAALAALGEQLGYAVERAPRGVADAASGEPGGRDEASGRGEEGGRGEGGGVADALVVASHGRDEEDVLADALREGVAYVGLVASPRRGAAIRDSLDVPPELRERLHTPAGLDLGGRTPQEIALSILAEIVQEAHRRRDRFAAADHARVG